MLSVMEVLNLRGMEAQDKVTRLKGVITSVSFDINGCIQVLLVPGVGGDGKLGDAYWFDVGHLTIFERQVEPPALDMDKGVENKPTKM